MSNRKFERKLKKIIKKGERQKQIKSLEDVYAQYYSEKKKKKVSNIMLVTVVIAVIGYVVADFVLQYYTGAEISPTITTCWFAFWTTEVLALTGIKVSKVKHNYDGTYSTSEDSHLDAFSESDDEICG